MRARWLPVSLALALVLDMLLTTSALAGAPAPPPQRPGAMPPAMALSAEQLDAFVELTGDPKPAVWQRLLADPGLVPYAAAAADARLERRASGKTMTIAGFTILGVGVAGGYILFLYGATRGLDCDRYGGSCEPSGNLMLGGAVVMLAAIGVGCGLGIPGIIRMVRPSDAENEATGRYQMPGLAPLPPYPVFPGGASLRLPAVPLRMPLLSFRF